MFNDDFVYGVDDSEIFVEEKNDDCIDPYSSRDWSCYELEASDPQYYEEFVFFSNLTRDNVIHKNLCNMKTLKKMIDFLVERFEENGVYADVVVIDKKNIDSSKHNRKTEDDIEYIEKLIHSGLNNSQIERLTGITRKTVAKYRNRFR